MELRRVEEVREVGEGVVEEEVMEVREEEEEVMEVREVEEGVTEVREVEEGVTEVREVEGARVWGSVGSSRVEELEQRET